MFWLIARGAVSTLYSFWSMNMTGVYACLFEAVCDVTTVPHHLKLVYLRSGNCAPNTETGFGHFYVFQSFYSNGKVFSLAFRKTFTSCPITEMCMVSSTVCYMSWLARKGPQDQFASFCMWADLSMWITWGWPICAHALIVSHCNATSWYLSTIFFGTK